LGVGRDIFVFLKESWSENGSQMEGKKGVRRESPQGNGLKSPFTSNGVSSSCPSIVMDPKKKCPSELFEDFCSEFMCSYDESMGHIVHNCGRFGVDGTFIGELLKQDDGDNAAAKVPGPSASAGAAQTTETKTCKKEAEACEACQEACPIATCPTHSIDCKNEDIMCQHEHKTYVQDGVQYEKCTHSHSVKSKIANRLAVQKYRKKKKVQFEQLKEENVHLKDKVRVLEEQLKNALDDKAVTELTNSERIELAALRETVRTVQGLIGGSNGALGGTSI